MSGFNTFFEKNAYRLLIIFYAIAYLLPISNRKLWIPDEARYAEISREMVSSGDWVVPHLLGLDYFEKPIAGYWLNSISQLLFGENHFSVRFASAFCTGLTGLLIFWFSQHIFQSRKKSFVTTAIYLSFFLVYAVGTYSVLDAMVTLWLDLTLVSFYWSFQVDNSRQKLLGYAVMGVAAGLGFLTKGFISLVIPVMVALPYLVYHHGTIRRNGPTRYRTKFRPYRPIRRWGAAHPDRPCHQGDGHGRRDAFPRWARRLSTARRNIPWPRERESSRPSRHT